MTFIFSMILSFVIGAVFGVVVIAAIELLNEK